MRNYLKDYQGKKILITGGAGCIGRSLICALLKAEAERIFLIDDLSSSEKWNIPVERILGVPRLEPHVYSDSEYEKMKKTVNKMTKNGIVLFQV